MQLNDFLFEFLRRKFKQLEPVARPLSASKARRAEFSLQCVARIFCQFLAKSTPLLQMANHFARIQPGQWALTPLHTKSINGKAVYRIESEHQARIRDQGIALLKLMNFAERDIKAGKVIEPAEAKARLLKNFESGKVSMNDQG
jgi:hypothetical protein